MMYWAKEHGRKYWIKKAIFIPIFIVAGIFVFGTVVMLLWNGILPAILGVSTITFWQAIGILLLSKILFGGFRGRSSRSKDYRDKYKWSEKWKNMSEEEKEQFKAEWKKHWCKPPKEQE